MTQKSIIIFYTFLLINVLSIHSYAQENCKVRSVKFSGNQSLSSRELKFQMTTYGTGAFKEKVLRKRPYLYSEEVLNIDIEKLKRFYQQEGFLHVELSLTDLQIDQDKKTVKLTIQVVEGKPVLIRNVRFNAVQDSFKNGDRFEPIMEKARPSLQLVETKRFRESLLKSDQEILLNQFHDSGFPYIKLRPELELIESEIGVDVIWNIESGPECVFGKIMVSGNEKIKSRSILKQLALSEGEVFQKKLIDKSQEQIYALGAFQFVTMKALLSQQKKTVIPMNIQIKEAPRFTTKFGVGYGREDHFRTFINLRKYGVLGRVNRLELLLKHSGLEPYNIDVKWTRPFFFTPQTALTLNPFLRRELEPGYSVKRLGTNVSLLHRITSSLKGSVSYVNERVSQDTSKTSSVGQDPAVDDELYNKSGVNLGFTFDNSTPLFSPEQGMFAALTFKTNGLVFPSDYHYTRFLFDVRQYQNLSGAVFAYRLKIGSVNSLDDNGFVPVEVRFYSGGSSSVRGWTRAQLGPKGDDDIPTGGKSLLEGSAELRYPIVKKISGVLFCDFGNVWLDSYKYKLNELRYAAGVGLRLNTIIGPIRFDIARPIFDEEKQWQYHISVGHAF